MVTQEELDKMSPEEIAELQKQNCIFCKIVKGEIPAEKVYENDKVLAILDINPAHKGHLLVLPKEHYPILPLIPPDVFKELFSTAKLLSTAIREGMLSAGTSLFIANGGVAGQQAPHFLFHIIPRDKDDGLTNFVLPQKDELVKEQESILSPLKNNLPLMMQNHFKRIGVDPIQFFKQATGKQSADQNPTSQNAVPTGPDGKPLTPEQIKEIQVQMERKREIIAKMIDENPDVRNLLITDLKKFRETIAQNKDLVKIFEGVDLESLSQNIKQAYAAMDKQNNTKQQTNTGSSSSMPSTSPTSTTSNAISTTADMGNAGSGNNPSPLPPLPPPPVQQTSTKKPEVFLGENPLTQRDKVFAYLEEKPKAKDLLITDLTRFKELLVGRPDIQEIFYQVNLDKLSEKLKAIADKQSSVNQSSSKDQTSQNTTKNTDFKNADNRGGDGAK